MPSPWFFFCLIAASMIFGCLRVIGTEYHTAVAWHDLRVRVQRLRREQQRRLESSADHEPSLRRIQRGRTGDMPSLVEAAEPVTMGVPVEAGIAEAVEVPEALAA